MDEVVKDTYILLLSINMSGFEWYTDLAIDKRAKYLVESGPEYYSFVCNHTVKHG